VAARYTFRRLFLAGLTALLADAVGFAVLMVIDIPVIRDLALTASIGVAVLIFTNLMLLPVLLSYVGVSRQGGRARLRDTRAGTRRAAAGAQAVGLLLDRFTERALGDRASVARRCCWRRRLRGQPAAEDRRPRQRRARAACPDSRYNRDNAYITSHYTLSSDQFAVMVKTAKEGCLNYETLVEADRLAWQLQQVPGVQRHGVAGRCRAPDHGGTNEGSPKWLTIARNQDVLNYAAQQASVNNPELFNNATVR
jgi:hypothetical protein